MFQLAAAVHAEIEIKKSRFLGQLYPVNNRAEARSKLAEIRAQHPNAVHVCWVLLCDGDSGLDDDGEPSGTAAKPMYNVLVHKELFNVLAVVVRYWGGCKLGAGGLTRAYGQAISDTFKIAELVPVEILSEAHFAVEFSDESSLRRLCEQEGVSIIEVNYAEKATLHVRMKASQASKFEDTAFDLLRGNLQKLEKIEL
ncbi:YigZ family protein [Undibacterium piscinae]|uniref:YigZ family protein n=1 Tax=Undibacterium piscinae TaxID=2495591 RepID=A0A6M4A5U0_9BURK|nr:YigZ family protein [Undibacterium piscinae]